MMIVNSANHRSSKTTHNVVLLAGLLLFTLNTFVYGATNADNKITQYKVANFETGKIDSFFNTFPKSLSTIDDKLIVQITNYGYKNTYYDTRILSLDQKSSLLYFQKDHIKSYDNANNNITLSIMGQQDKKFISRNYNRKISPVDKHPLLGMIKRSERPLFIDELSKLGIKSPLDLKKTISVIHDGKVLNLHYAGYQLRLATHHKVNTRFLSRDNIENFISIPSLNETGNIKNEDIKLLISIRTILLDALERNFISLTPADNFLKKNPYKLVRINIPAMDLIIQYPLAYKSLQALLFLSILTLIALLIKKLAFTGHTTGKQTVYSSKQ